MGNHTFCPYITRIGRRTFLKLGGLACGAWTLADQLRVWGGSGGSPSRETAVIQIFMGGGPSHIDMYDLKPTAPREIRGEFSPIATCVNGIRISEHLPRQASVMDKLAIVRSVSHTNAGHLPASHWMMTGYEPTVGFTSNINPSMGSVVSRLRGPNVPGLPSYVSVPRKQLLGGAGYLGTEYNPFTPESDPSRKDFAVKDLSLVRGMTKQRLGSRQELRKDFDSLRRQLDGEEEFSGLDQFSREAYELVTSDLAARAFDLSEEDSGLRERYGNFSGGQGCLLARRLVEAGVTFVTVLSGGEWDTHTDNFGRLKSDSLPKMDRAISALVGDLYERGLDKRVLVIANGEFGRTPKINKDAGRDHWPGTSCVLFSGGGLKVGQMIGETDPQGAYPITKRHTPGDVLSTVYHFLGIDIRHEFRDRNQRLFPVLNEGEPIRELFA